jgi:hypothetical protein
MRPNRGEVSERIIVINCPLRQLAIAVASAGLDCSDSLARRTDFMRKIRARHRVQTAAAAMPIVNAGFGEAGVAVRRIFEPAEIYMNCANRKIAQTIRVNRRTAGSEFGGSGMFIWKLADSVLLDARSARAPL